MEEFAGSGVAAAAEPASENQGEDESRRQDLRPDRGSGVPQEFSDEPEDDVWEGGFSPKAMAGSFFAFALASMFCLAGLVIAFVHQQAWLGWLVALAIPFLCLAQSWRVVKRCLSQRYRLTNRRLFLQIGLLRSQKHQIDLGQVETVRIHQNMWDRLLNVGSIEILTRDRHIGRLLLAGIDDADSVAEKIRSLGRRVRDKEVAPVERVVGGT
ncbi:MAG: PH domain-containing protein [Planctomycetes bacterium]|nr:PH domain-containing protein [Planctomycetota bacterium]